MRAMILAAGLGSRLKNITESIPKPLLKLNEEYRLIDIAVINLLKAGVTNIAVNLHYKGKLVKNYLLRQYPKIQWHFYPETELLDTGGGIANAGSFLSKSKDVIILNSDILFFIDLKKFITKHINSQFEASLLIKPSKNQERAICFNHQNVIRNIYNTKGIPINKSNSESRKQYGQFIGIQIFKHQFLRYFKPGKYSSIKIFLEQIKNNSNLQALSIDRQYWVDAGTPANLNKARKDFQMFTKFYNPIDINRIEKLNDGASNQCCYRIYLKEKTEIIKTVKNNEAGRNLQNQNLFLQSNKLPVPLISKHYNNFLIMENAGKFSLLDKIKESGLTQPIYQKIIEQVLKLEKITAEKIPTAIKKEIMTLDVILIYKDLENFNDNYFKNKLTEPELQNLAGMIDSYMQKFPLTLIHRDLQSTNILINQTNDIKIIDWESMKIGYPIYDVAALLIDSYLPFNYDFIKSNLQYYLQKTRFKYSEFDFWLMAFLRITHDLGVFSTIGKNKKFFKDKIPAAEKRLAFVISKLDKTNFIPDAIKLVFQT